MPDTGGRLATALLLALGILSPAAATPGALLWSEARVPGRATAFATGAQSLVVLGQLASGSAIRVYEPETGALRWQQAWPDELRGDPVVRGGLIIIAGGSDLVALDLQSGHVRWREPIGNGGSPRLVGAGSQIFLASGDGVLTAHALRTGHVLWRNDAGPVTSFVVRRGRIAAIGTRQSDAAPARLVVRVHDAKTGAQLWQDADHFDSRGATAKAVAWAGDRIVVGGSVTRDYGPADYYDNQLLLAYDAVSGARLWQNEHEGYRDKVVFGIATHANRAFALTRATSGFVWRAEAYDSRTGARLWNTGPLFIDGQVLGPVFAGGAVHVAADSYSSPAEFLAASLATGDGAVRWRAHADAASPESFATAIDADSERLYVAGSVYDLDALENRLAVWAYSLR